MLCPRVIRGLCQESVDFLRGKTSNGPRIKRCLAVDLKQPDVSLQVAPGENLAPAARLGMQLAGSRDAQAEKTQNQTVG